MTRIVQGVAVVLHTPMQGKPVQFGAPGPFPVHANAPVMYRGYDVGEVSALRVEGNRVLWAGRLHPPVLVSIAPESPLAIPVPQYRPMVERVHGMIAAHLLVGVPALTEARTEREGGCMVLAGWTVARMELLTLQAAPWPGLTLALR
jgi:hypothetical protein